jgi:hypothetical protein
MREERLSGFNVNGKKRHGVNFLQKKLDKKARLSFFYISLLVSTYLHLDDAAWKPCSVYRGAAN